MSDYDVIVIGSGAPGATLTALLIVSAAAVALVAPSIVLLFTLVRRNLVEETARPLPVPEP